MALLLLLFLQGRGKVKSNNQKKLVNLKWGKRGKVHGVIFGRKGNKVLYSETTKEQHCFVCAGTGKGKTSSLLIPTLRSWTGSSLTIDISGDISKNCPNMENKLVFEPENEETIPYDVFSMIDKMDDTDKQNEALCQLAILLMPESPNMNDNARFFLMNGRKILMASLIAFYHENLDFCEICRKVVSSSWQNLFNEIDEIGNEEAVMYINGFVGANEANTSGCFQQTCEAINLFATNVTNNEIEDLRNEIFKNQLDHDRKQRELEEVFSCFPINHVENEDIWNEKPVLIHKDNRNYIDFDILTSINSNFDNLKQIYYIKFIVSNIKKDMFSFRNIYLYNKNAVFNNENNVFTNKIFYCSGYYFTSFSSFYPLGFLIQSNSYLKSRKKRDIKNINYAFISRRNNFIYNNVYRSIDLYIYNPVFNTFFKDWLLRYVSYIKNIPKISTKGS